MSGSKPNPWHRLRDLEPPLGSQQRVLARVEDEVFAKPSRSPRWRYVLVPIAAAVAVIVWVGLRDGSPPVAGQTQDPPAALPAAPAPQTAASAALATTPKPLEHDVAVSELPPTEIVVLAGTQKSLELPTGRVVVAGPATVRVDGKTVILSEGRVVVSGYAVIKTPRCSAKIDGDAEVRVDRDGVDGVDVRVTRGSADVTAGCHVRYMAVSAAEPTTNIGVSEPSETKTSGPPPRPDESIDAKPAPQDDKETEVSTKETEVSTKETEARTKETEARTKETEVRAKETEVRAKEVKASALRKQVDAFRRARHLAETDPRAAIEAFDDFATTWPRSPLRPEVAAERERAAKRITK